jgi:hypothetical protein
MPGLRNGWRIGLLAATLLAVGQVAPSAGAQSVASGDRMLCAEPQFIRLASAIVGQPFQFSEGVGCLQSGDTFGQPTIDWGDGTTSAGAVTDVSASAETVSGQHTYSQPGVYAIKVRVTDEATGEALTRGWHTEVNAIEPLTPAPTGPPPTPSPKGSTPPPPASPSARIAVSSATFSLTRHSRRRAGSIAVVFSGTPSSATAARISWGDGRIARGRLAGSAQHLEVFGHHRWHRRGRYVVRIALLDGHHHVLARATVRAVVR